MGWERCMQVLVQNPEGKIPLRRPGYEWEDNIKVSAKEMVWEGVQWINLAHIVIL
jgi:hypothetical protein